MDEKFVIKRIISLRNKKGVSAMSMSRELDQNESYINHIELGNTMPSIKGLFCICKYLGVTLQEFFDESNDSPELISEIVSELKKLDDEKLRGLLALVKS